jgi:hypothetical protein
MIDTERLTVALQHAWNEWCSDTGCVPDGFTIKGPPTTRVVADFQRGAAFVERVAAWYDHGGPT